MYFDQLFQATEADRIKKIHQNPLIEAVYNGKLTHWHYVAYLRETYYLVQHTPAYLRLATQKLTNDEWLRNYYLKFAEAEEGHHLLCLHDIRSLGEDPDKVLNGKPSNGAWAMITQNYYLATFGNPVGLIGDNLATEGLGISLASEMAQILEQQYGFSSDTVTFLKVHGQDDAEHFNLAKQAIERYGQSHNDYLDILHAWKSTLHYYGQLFTDVLIMGNESEKQNTM